MSLRVPRGAYDGASADGASAYYLSLLPDLSLLPESKQIRSRQKSVTPNCTQQARYAPVIYFAFSSAALCRYSYFSLLTSYSRPMRLVRTWAALQRSASNASKRPRGGRPRQMVRRCPKPPRPFILPSPPFPSQFNR